MSPRTRCALLLCLCLPVLASPAPSISPAPPAPPRLIRISASSLYDAGRQNGELAQHRIQTWFASKEMTDLFTFALGPGNTTATNSATNSATGYATGPEAFATFKRINAAEFPSYADEIRGIAHGANVSEDKVWCANLIPELESLMPPTPATQVGHCTDIFSHNSNTNSNTNSSSTNSSITNSSDSRAAAPTASAPTVVHGHNEDWSESVKPLWYFVAYTAQPGADFESCAGLVYPGTLIGYAPAFGANQVYVATFVLLLWRGPLRQ